MDIEPRDFPPFAAGSRVWYRILLTEEQVAAGHTLAVRRLFRAAISGLIDQTGMWLVAASHDGTAVTEQLFLSPASIGVVPHLIVEYRARPSAPPERARSALLVGDEAAWDQLPYSTH